MHNQSQDIVTRRYFVSAIGGLGVTLQSCTRFAEGPRQNGEPHCQGEACVSLGSVFPEVLLRDAAGAPLRTEVFLRGRWTFVFARAAFSEHDFEYPNILSSRYHENDLRFLFILPHMPGSAELLRLKNAATGSITIGIDQDFSLGRRLGLPPSDYSAAYFVDPNRLVRIAMPHPAVMKPIMMRQLTEEYVLKSPPAPPTTDPPGYELGAQIPNVRVWSVRQRQPQDLRANLTEADTVIFFRANCTTCGLTGYLREVSHVARLRQERRGGRVVVVFSRLFNREELEDAAREADALSVVDLLHAQAYISEWEDPYWVEVGPLNEARVMRFSATKSLRSCTTVQEWLRDGREAT